MFLVSVTRSVPFRFGLRPRRRWMRSPSCEARPLDLLGEVGSAGCGLRWLDFGYGTSDQLLAELD
jgi:hypothetical protein